MNNSLFKLYSVTCYYGCICRLLYTEINRSMKKYIGLLCVCWAQIFVLAMAKEVSVNHSLAQVVEKDYSEDLRELRERFPLTCLEVDGTKIREAERFAKGFKSVEFCEPDWTDVRSLSMAVRGLAYAASSGLPEGKAFNRFMETLLADKVIERIPGFQFSHYDNVRQIPANFLSALPVCSQEQQSRLIAAVKHLVEFDRLYQDAAVVKNNVNTDYIYNMLPHLFVCALHQPDEELAKKDMLAFSHYLSACTQYSSGSKDGLKIDGTGFHHHTHYNGYMYAYKTWVHYIARLRGTAFRIDADAYRRISGAVVSQYLMATVSASDQEHYYANSLAGRHPFAGLMVDFTQELFRDLIAVGGDINGKDIDEDLAAYYNAFFQTDYYKGIKPKDLNGFYSFNYSPAGIYRQGNWIATMRCPTTRFWGGEIYNKTNRFGRYQSHGTLEILYNGSLQQSGYPVAWERFSGERGGWDWNVVPGSTTVHFTDWKEMMPNGNDADRFDQWAATTDFSGALTWGDCGVFAAAFDQGDHWGGRRFKPTNLSFCKSVFAFDGVLVSMGSGIASHGDYDEHRVTATNLFQAMDNGAAPILDGKRLTKGTSVVLGAKSHWMITPCTTGYLVPAGNDSLVIYYGEQTTPGPEGANESSFGTRHASKAYINHGVKPERKKYCFAVVPATTPEAMSAYAERLFRKDGLFEIKQHQDSLHILKHIPSGTLAYALFAPANALQEGVLRSSDTELLIMERCFDRNKSLELAVCSPDLGTVPIEGGKEWISTPTISTLTFDGIWLPDAETAGVVSCSHGQSHTKLVLKLQEGLSLQLKLHKSKSK